MFDCFAVAAIYPNFVRIANSFVQHNYCTSLFSSFLVSCLCSAFLNGTMRQRNKWERKGPITVQCTLALRPTGGADGLQWDQKTPLGFWAIRIQNDQHEWFHFKAASVNIQAVWRWMWLFQPMYVCWSVGRVPKQTHTTHIAHRSW